VGRFGSSNIFFLSSVFSLSLYLKKDIGQEKKMWSSYHFGLSNSFLLLFYFLYDLRLNFFCKLEICFWFLPWLEWYMPSCFVLISNFIFFLLIFLFLFSFLLKNILVFAISIFFFFAILYYNIEMLFFYFVLVSDLIHFILILGFCFDFFLKCLIFLKFHH